MCLKHGSIRVEVDSFRLFDLKAHSTVHVKLTVKSSVLSPYLILIELSWGRRRKSKVLEDKKRLKLCE